MSDTDHFPTYREREWEEGTAVDFWRLEYHSTSWEKGTSPSAEAHAVQNVTNTPRTVGSFHPARRR